MKKQKSGTEKGRKILKRAGLIIGILIAAFIVIGILAADTKAPVLTMTDQTVEYGTTLSVEQLVQAEDNRSEFPVVTLLETPDGITYHSDKQEITFDDPGEYLLNFSAMDDAENESRGQVTVFVVDNQKPQISKAETQKEICYSDDFVISINGKDVSESAVSVTAEDKTKLSWRITSVEQEFEDAADSDYEVDPYGQKIKFFRLGIYKVDYEIIDVFENASEGSVKITVVDRVSPELLNLSNQYELKDVDSQKPDYLNGVSALDEIDGELTGQIQVDDSQVQYGKPGIYAVIFSVADKSGNECRVQKSLKIADTTGPELKLAKSSYNVTVGDSAPGYMDGVSASDNGSGDVTGFITVDDSAVNYNSPGTYYVTYSVNDGSGNVTTKTASVKVIEKQTVSNSGSSGSGTIVLITKTGECYHTHKCGNGTYYETTLENAKSRGLRPCKKCFG